MKGKQLLILIVVAAVLGAIAFISSRDRDRRHPSRTGDLLLADLDLNQVMQVEITQAGATATITQVDQQWVIPAKFGHPADFDKFREAMRQLSELKIGSEIELTDAQRDSLELTPAAATRVTFKDANDATLVNLLIGTTRAQKGLPEGSPYANLADGRYVSVDEGTTAILVSESLQQIRSNPSDWLKTELTSVIGPELISIRVSGPDQATIEMQRDPKTGDLTLTNLAAGETFDAAKRYTIESALSYLRFNDIADPALTDAELGMNHPVTFEARTESGQLYIASIGGSPTDSTDRFARFSVAYVGADDGATTATNTTDSATNSATTARAAALALNQQLAKWTYLIPAYKAEAMTHSRDDLLKQPTEDDPTTPPIPTTNNSPLPPTSNQQPTANNSPSPERSGDHAGGPAEAGTPPAPVTEPPLAEEKGAQIKN